MIDRTGVVYVENDFEYDLWRKTRNDNNVVDRIGMIYVETKMELSESI